MTQTTIMSQSSKDNRIVNSWTEWSPLEEVVIGHANDICFEPQEPGFKIEFGDAFLRDKLVWCEGRWPKKYVEAANRELDYLCEVLESEGVKVRRPDNIKNYISSQVPDGKSYWTSHTQYGSLFPRDIMTTIGNNILEAPTSRRGRYFEYLAYRNITRDLWRRDPNCCWKACPKPSMSDSMYWEDFWNLTEAEHLAAEGTYKFPLKEEEPAFDAADIMRVGNHLFFQKSLVSNKLGIEWVSREFPQFKVSICHFPWDHFPEHIDVTMVPLRPPTSGSNGVVIINPARPPLKSESNIWYINEWDFYVAPEPVIQEEPLTFDGDKWISINTLSLSEKLVIIEENEIPMKNLLNDLGIETIEIPFRSVNNFGGSFHCVSWDIRRDDEAKNYFPNEPNNDCYRSDLLTVIDVQSSKHVKNPQNNKYQIKTNDDSKSLI